MKLKLIAAGLTVAVISSQGRRSSPNGATTTKTNKRVVTRTRQIRRTMTHPTVTQATGMRRTVL